MKRLWRVLLLTGLLVVALAAGASAVSWTDYVEINDPMLDVESYGDPFALAIESCDGTKSYLASETYHETDGWRTYYYDADGAMTAYEDADGKQVVSELYRYQTNTNADGTAWIGIYEIATGELYARMDFDAQGRRVRESEADGSFYAYTYDANSRVIKLEDNNGTTTYTYDAAGRMTSATYDDGTSVSTRSYTFDSQDRLTQVTGDGALWMTIRYDSDGRLISYSYGDWTYRYQYSGDLLTKQTCSDGSSVVYTYDAEGRLTKAVIDYPAEEGLSYTQTYAYAAVTPVTPTPTTGFRDVPADAWYAQYVQSMVDKGFMKGQAPDVFAPNANMTVAEAITLAVRMAAGEGQSFPQGAPWYQVYVDWAKAHELPWDYADYNAKITRTEFAQLFAAVYRSSEAMQQAVQPMNTVPDGSIPDVAMTDANAADIYLLYRLGILAGSDEAHSFKPGSDILRSEVAAIACRLLDEGRQSFTMP